MKVVHENDKTARKLTLDLKGKEFGSLCRSCFACACIYLCFSKYVLSILNLCCLFKKSRMKAKIKRIEVNYAITHGRHLTINNCDAENKK